MKLNVHLDQFCIVNKFKVISNFCALHLTIQRWALNHKLFFCFCLLRQKFLIVIFNHHIWGAVFQLKVLRLVKETKWFSDPKFISRCQLYKLYCLPIYFIESDFPFCESFLFTHDLVWAVDVSYNIIVLKMNFKHLLNFLENSCSFCRRIMKQFLLHVSCQCFVSFK
jgi:hypothetical protein